MNNGYLAVIVHLSGVFHLRRRVRFLDFRHSFGSLLIEQGEDLNYIKEQLGHHSITLTVDTYGHRLRSDRKAVDGLDEVENSDLSDHPGKVVAER